VGDLIRLRKARPAPVNGMTAAAKILQATVQDAPKPEAWAEDAWHFRDTTGEVRYAEMWLGNNMGRARLFAARRDSPAAEPEPLPDTHPASAYVAQLAGGIGGQSALLRAFATYLMTPGAGYLIGYAPDQRWGGATFQVRDADEIRLSPNIRTEDGRYTYDVQTGDQTNDWMNLGPNGLVVKVWRPDPQRHWRPDSPVRGALPILRELSLLTQAIESMATSRLAGAGLLPLPNDLDFPGGFEAFIEELLKTFVAPIKNRASAAAFAPFPFKVKPDHLGKIGPVHFFSPFDEHALELRNELIQRLGTAMDMPVRSLTGEQENHWGKQATAEEGTKIHVVPNLELVCDGLTKGYLTPAMLGEARLRQAMDLPEDPGMLMRATEGQEMVGADGEQILVWYDISDLTAKPDKSMDAKDAWDRIEISGDAYRQETGLSEWDPPSGDERNQRIWLKVLDNNPDPELTRAALVNLGVVEEGELPPATVATPSGGPAPQPAEEEPPAPLAPVPATEPSAPAPSREDRPEAAGVDLALVAAADAMVYRVLEKAGNRLRQAMARRSPGRRLAPDLDVAAPDVHTVCVAADLQPVDRLLDGAWDRAPVIAAQLGVPEGPLVDALDGYVRGLLAERRPHSWELLQGYLTAAPVMSPAELVLRVVAS
jgi:hypothetical protein